MAEEVERLKIGYKVSKYTGILFVCIAGGIMIGVLLLTAAYMLPTDRMKSHVADSDELFNYEGIYPQIIQGYKSSQLDNYTDGLMYATAIHPGSGKPLKDAMRNARYEYENTNMVQSLNDYANDVSAKEELRYEMIYPRYWHGYLIFLKPLLLFFNVSEIRMINMVLQGGLLLLLLFLVRRRMGERWQIPVLLMAAVLNPIVLPLSLQFSWVYYIALACGIVLLSAKRVGNLTNLVLIFLVTGMATSYLDLLTYPLITLGLPLTLALLMQEGRNWRWRLKLTLCGAISWAVGYAGMWAGKWICAWMFGGLNLFGEVLGKILERTSNVGELKESLNAWLVIGKNVQVLLRWPYLLIAALFAGSCLALWLRSDRRLPDRGLFLKSLPYLICAALPVVWIGLTANHSWVHYWYTYRELSVTALAGAVWIMELLFPQHLKTEDKNG